MPWWALLTPIASALLLFGAILMPVGVVLALVCLVGLMGSVIASVHHAEVVAHRVGEPFGTLVLSLAITIIEVALILSMMLANPTATATLPRDTVFATVMIICNGVVGLCLLVGGIRHREQSFHLEGANTGLATLIALSSLTLVLPAFTTTVPGPTYSRAQLAFASIASIVLWATFVFVQTVRHRDYFLSADDPAAAHAGSPTNRLAAASFGLLLVALIAVVGLAKVLSPKIEVAMAAAGAPKSAIGIAIALLVLLPETWAATRAAAANQLQTSFNLAFGSALASIGLTIPAVAVASVFVNVPLALGLDSKELVLLVLSFVVASITLVSGRTHVMPGVVHLVIFAAFVFFALIP
jgi:Ca2+:H+ antiporter